MRCCRTGDILLIEGDHEALDRLVAQAKLSLIGQPQGRRRRRRRDDRHRGRHRREFEPDRMVGGKPASLRPFQRQSSRCQPQERTARPQGRHGDAAGSATSSCCRAAQTWLPQFLRDFGLLPLAERPLLLGSVRRGIVPVLILLAAMGATAFGVVPVAVAFFAAAVAMVLFRVIPDPRNLRRGRRADPGHAGSADTGQRFAAPHGRD